MDENKIDRLEQSIWRLEKIVGEQQAQIESLKQMIIARRQPMPPVQPQRPAVPPQAIQQTAAQPIQQTAAQPIQQSVMPQAIQPAPQINPAAYGVNAPVYAKRERNYGNMENKIGTSMGIAASVLVFIGIVLFVTLVYSSLTDIVKVTCIFVFSFAILAAGTVMMKRRTNAFTMSVTGCGMGAVYLSLFVTHIYFGMINKFILYLLIAAWAVAVYFFFSKKSYVFKLIGQIGIAFSVLFGCFSLAVLYIASDEWWNQYIFLSAFFIITSMFYLIIKRENTAAKAAPLVILDYISIMALALLGVNHTNAPTLVLFIVTALYMFFLLYVYIFMAEQKNRTTASGIIYMIMSGTTCCFLFNMANALDFSSKGAEVFLLRLLILILAFAAELLREYKKENKDSIRVVMTVILYILLLNNTACFEILYRMAGFGIYILPMLAAAYYFKDKTALWLSYVTMFLFAMGGSEYLTINVILSIVAVAVSGFALYRDKKMYYSGCKCVWYIISLILIVNVFTRLAYRFDMHFNLRFAWSYIILAVINTLAVHIGLERDWSGRTKEKEKDIICVCGVFNIGLMLVGLLLLGSRFNGILMVGGNYDWWLRMIILVVVAGVYCNNVKTIYEKNKNNPLAGIYTGAKLSLFVFGALRAYSFSGPMVSIGWLLLAIILILSGFKWQYKYLRMYGLFLSMFSIMKLLVFDISYDNAVIRAGSFLVSGGLCFIISLLYNAYSKKE